MANKKNLSGMSVIVLVFVFGLALAGCANTTDSAEPSAAEQLTAEINAIEAGKATVSGDTVTLTGGIRLETALTVHEGVTLDLTKETLQLGNGTTLTVNGTVNAKAEGINIDSETANPATINGSGIIQLKSKGRLLGIWEGKKLTLDGVTLVGLDDNNTSLVEVINGGEFVLKSGAIKDNTHIHDNSSSGGGVRVYGTGSTFTMQGGTISNNTAKSKNAHGGGVFVWQGTFTMSGGTISGNTALASGNGAYGGGVEVQGTGAIFTMSGNGMISGNTASEPEKDECGGGVHVVNSSTFILAGGTIYGNSAGSNSNTAGTGSALFVIRATAIWGTDGTYTGGGSQTGGSNICTMQDYGGNQRGKADDTLIAVP